MHKLYHNILYRLVSNNLHRNYKKTTETTDDFQNNW